MQEAEAKRAEAAEAERAAAEERERARADAEKLALLRAQVRQFRRMGTSSLFGNSQQCWDVAQPGTQTWCNLACHAFVNGRCLKHRCPAARPGTSLMSVPYKHIVNVALITNESEQKHNYILVCMTPLRGWHDPRVET